MTGKPARLLRTAWTEAWEAPDSPGTLPMPLQFLANTEAMSRIHRAAHLETSRARELIGSPVGQIVGRMNAVRPAREVIREMVEEYLDTMERLNALGAAAGGRA